MVISTSDHCDTTLFFKKLKKFKSSWCLLFCLLLLTLTNGKASIHIIGIAPLLKYILVHSYNMDTIYGAINYQYRRKCYRFICSIQ